MLVFAFSWKAQNGTLGKIIHFSPVSGGCCIHASSPLAVLGTKAEFPVEFQTFIGCADGYLWEQSIPTSWLHS